MIFFTACDCCQVVSGIVIDEKSGLPLRDVNVYKKSQVNNNETTDSNGYFEIFSISGGLFGCPPMEVVFECENYETKEVKIPAGGNKTVKLKKKN